MSGLTLAVDFRADYRHDGVVDAGFEIVAHAVRMEDVVATLQDEDLMVVLGHLEADLSQPLARLAAKEDAEVNRLTVNGLEFFLTDNADIGLGLLDHIIVLGFGLLHDANALDLVLQLLKLTIKGLDFIARVTMPRDLKVRKPFLGHFKYFLHKSIYFNHNYA